jgi:DNA gyrase subunit A
VGRKGRATLGVQVAKLSDKNGDLVGGLTVDADDEVHGRHGEGQDRALAVRTVRHTGRNTMGVKFAKPDRVTRSSPSPATSRAAPRPRMAYRLT